MQGVQRIIDAQGENENRQEVGELTAGNNPDTQKITEIRHMTDKPLHPHQGAP